MELRSPNPNPSPRSPQPSPHYLGSLKLRHILFIYLSLILFAPLYCLYMSVKLHQEPPFPHTTVTGTACHYPQATVFRWIMISAASFLCLVFHVIFRWYEMMAGKYGYTGSVYGWMYWPTVLSVIGYLMAIATIDSGGTGTYHAIGAAYFFICLYFLVLNFTLISHKLHSWDTRFMTPLSLYTKTAVLAYLTLVYLYCFIGLVFYPEERKNSDNKYGVIVEWNLVYAGLVWVFCFLGDFWGVELVLDKGKGKWREGRREEEEENNLDGK